MKNVVDPEQAGNNVFSDPTAVRQAGKKNETKKVLVLPIPLHGALMEVAFREGVKLKTLVKESGRRRRRRLESRIPVRLSAGTSRRSIRTASSIPRYI